MWLYAAAIAGYIGIFAGSTPYGWSSPAIPLYKEPDSPVKITNDEGAWIASTFMLGCAMGPLLTLLIAHVAGRKTLLIAASVPWFIGWTMIVFARTPWELMLARLISGTGTGTCFAVLPMYLGEIAPAKIRGILLTAIMMACRFGILFSYVLCPFVSLQTSALISLILPIPYVCCFMWLPESPYHFMRRGRREDASKSLAILRGTKDITAELHTIETSVKAEMANSGGLGEIFLVPGNRKSMTVGVMLGLIQQLSGSQAIMMYTQTIFDQANVDLEGKYMAMILGLVQIVCTGICAVIVDRNGRRFLLLFSVIGSLVSTGIVAIYFTLQYSSIDTSAITWLPATGCMFYVVFYSLGLAPLPVTVMGELFPTNIKSLACVLVTFISNLTGFTVGKTYQVISDSVGTHVAFWMFTLFNAIGTTYIYLSVPETKGKTLQEIQAELHHKKCDIDKVPA
ncbi:facilitated trehalose transporter Tret1 [Fopius arisanus]|uniref:Facilitated trehalose transporter Tret1 n=1 Tax=Fopius arisanus TaxID=64838 RepID=A0A9R1TRG8_9HYME|nr:PREDICTED: facilitated trehalose transporter Tret1-like [Fopius arisanus]